MPTHDLFHDAVKHGLTKDGWTITDDPLIIEFSGLDMYIDLGAEKLIAAEKDNQQIAVEVKSFLGPSVLTDFHVALGQFLNYRIALDAKEPRARPLPGRARVDLFRVLHAPARANRDPATFPSSHRL